jgi:hypothetical protein
MFAQAGTDVRARSKAHVACVLQERTILMESGYTNALVLNTIQLCATHERGRQVGARRRDRSAFCGCSAGGRARDRQWTLWQLAAIEARDAKQAVHVGDWVMTLRYGRA